MLDIYKTIKETPKPSVFKEKGSKFYGYAFPLSHEDQVATYIDQLKNKHSNAGHFCYAWQMGIEDLMYRVDDDGEPNNSAGRPIHGQIQAYDLTNILVVSVRYFGGIKLGVGGLIKAYRNSAKLVLENCKIIEKTVDRFFQLNFEYAQMSRVMRFIEENRLNLISQKMELDCQLIVSVRKGRTDEVLQKISELHKIRITTLEI